MAPVDVRADGPLAKLAEQTFGRPTQASPNVVNVTTLATRLVPNNPARVELIICNMAPNTLYIFQDASVSAARGIPVANGGGVVILNAAEDGEIVGWEWWGTMATAAGSTLTVEVLAI